MRPTRQREEKLLALFGKRRGEGPRSHRLVQGIGDDAALYRLSPNREMILSCDWFLEGTHFLAGRHPAESLGWKCLARALSDVAAMGGAPRCFLLSLALPPSRTGSWLGRFLAGLRRASRRLGCELVGGDTTRNRRILISITVVGELAAGCGITRKGARAGEAIFVSGRLGQAEQGWRLVRGRAGRLKPDDPRLRKHLYPEPRLALGQWLGRNHLATAMMDLSDGLSSDLPRLCAASGVGAVIEAARLPTPAALPGPEGLELALNGGDDYELLFTVAPENLGRIPPTVGGVRLTRIGRTTSGSRILVEVGRSRKRLRPGGWDPFAGSGA